jgi:hypothetical protein
MLKEQRSYIRNAMKSGWKVSGNIGTRQPVPPPACKLRACRHEERAAPAINRRAQC